MDEENSESLHRIAQQHCRLRDEVPLRDADPGWQKSPNFSAKRLSTQK
jgi:hypothetical protein